LYVLIVVEFRSFHEYCVVLQSLIVACMQVVLESPQEGRQYVFELNNRLIRDKELDGLTEIPVKPNITVQQPEPDSDGLEEFVPLVLPGQSLMVAI